MGEFVDNLWAEREDRCMGEGSRFVQKQVCDSEEFVDNFVTSRKR